MPAWYHPRRALTGRAAPSGAGGRGSRRLAAYSPRWTRRSTGSGTPPIRIELDGIRILTDPTIRERIGPLDRKVAAGPPPRGRGDRRRADQPPPPGPPRSAVAPPARGPPADRPGRLRADLPGGRPSRRRRVLTGPADDPRTADDRDRPGRPQRLPTAVRPDRRRRSGSSSATARRRIYFAGDTAIYPEMADIADLDLALVPVWGWGPNLRGGHMDPRMAAEAWPCSVPGSPSRSTGARSGRRARWGHGPTGCCCPGGVPERAAAETSRRASAGDCRRAWRPDRPCPR